MPGERIILETYRIKSYPIISKDYYIYCGNTLKKCNSDHCQNEKNKICSGNDIKIILSKNN